MSRLLSALGRLTTARRLSGPNSRPRVLFVGALYAGHRTRFLNLQANTVADPRIVPEFRTVTGWREGGAIESLSMVPASTRGRARALLEGACHAKVPRPDVIWTSAGDEVLAPYAWSQLGALRRPLIMDMDATPALLEENAELYYGRAAKKGLSRRLLEIRQSIAYSSLTCFVAWSRWAADGIEREGITPDRIRVIPPGVDISRWRFGARRIAAPLRLLLVGADFERKGGPLLLEVVKRRFLGRVELDIVTRAEIEDGPGIRVHRAEPNSPLLRKLFAEAHLFVLPTRAECFGIAVIEAMAAGLPVIMGDAGAAREIVDHGQSGWVIQPDPRSLAEALEAALAHPERLLAMGRRASETADKRFNGNRNDGLLVELMVEAHETFARNRAANSTRRGRTEALSQPDPR